MNKPAKQMKDKPPKPNAKDKQRGFGVVELLFTVATLSAAVVVMASRGPKLPPSSGE